MDGTASTERRDGASPLTQTLFAVITPTAKVCLI